MAKTRKHYRLEFQSEDSLTRLWSIRFTRVRAILAGALSIAAVLALLFVIMRFTPAGKIIPGWIEPDSKAKMVEMALRLDSLERLLHSEQQYSANVIAIMKGQAMSTSKENPDSLQDAPPALKYSPEEADSMLAPSATERLFRTTVEQRRNSSAK